MDTKPYLNNDMGFVKKPYAIQKVITNPDGTTQQVFVDAKTGKPIGNPQGYQIVQQPMASPDTRQKPTNTDIVTGRNDNANTSVSKAVEASKSDGSDLGYTNKPGAMAFAGFLPGPLGLGGMAANLGVNAANQKAVSDQRSVLGFSTEPGKRALGTVIDTNGYIGEAKVTAPNGQTSVAPVSFEADVNNRTSYTPEEARKREIAGLLTQATPQEQKAAIGTFNNEFPEQQSFSSKIAAATKGLMGNIFGSPATPMGAGTGLGFNNGSASGSYGNSFPTAPSAPTNTTTGYDAGRGPSVDTSGMSPGLY